MAKLLKKYRVIDMTNYVAGSMSCRLLADWGAEVIKVEGLDGDPWRNLGFLGNCPSTEEENPLYDLSNSSKKDVSLDIRCPQGMEILHKLLETADVFVTNTRAQSLKKLGLDYETLKERYPKLVYAHVTGYGPVGPDKDAPGYDTVAFWARTGFMSDLADIDSPPITPASAFGDVSTGTLLFGGICAALLGREATGKGDLVETSLYAAGIWLATTQVLMVQPNYNFAYPKSRFTNNPLLSTYKTKDGFWVAISITNYNQSFRAMCEALEVPELADDPRFNTGTKASTSGRELVELLDIAFAKLDFEELAKRFSAAQIVFDRLRHFKEVATDEQALANDYVRPFTFESGRSAVIGMPAVKSESLGRNPYTRGPHLGEHTDEVLAAAGYSKETIAKLKEENVIKQYTKIDNAVLQQ